MAKIATLTDNFATKDLGKWFWNTNASVVSGQLNLALNTSYDGYVSGGATYDLTSSSYSAQVIQVPNVGNGTTELHISCKLDANNAVKFIIGAGTLTAYRKVTGTQTSVGSVAYSAATVQYVRIRHNGTAIVWEYSANGATWTQLGTPWTPTFAITALTPELYAGYYGTEPNPGTAIVDNVNIAFQVLQRVKAATTTQTTTLTATLPGAATVGSTQIALITTTSGSSGITMPGGWTQRATNSAQVPNCFVYDRTAAATTDTSLTMTFPSGGAVIYLIEASGLTGFASAVATNGAGPSATFTAGPLTPATAATYLLAFVAHSTSTTDAFGAPVTLVDQHQLAGATSTLFHNAYAEGAVTGTSAQSVTVTPAASASAWEALLVAYTVPDIIAPTVPSGVTATANSIAQVTIAWTASTDAVGVASYRIRRGGVDLTGATALTGTSFADTSVVASTAYSYTVSAVDAAGNRSAESTAATVTTPAPPVIPPAPVPTPVPPTPVPARRLTVSVYQGNYVRVGQVPDYISCSITFAWLDVGTGELVVGEDDPIASNLLMADQVVVAVVIDLGSVRWSGRVAKVSLEREGPAGSGVITATLVDEWIWLQRMLASQNGASTSLTTMPQYDTRTGPAVSVAADFINAAAARLGVPVKASKPAVDTSPSVTLKARMTPLADLLADPMKAAGVTMTGQIWLPSDPQPPDLTTTLTTPTVVFRPQVLADKPWLQWTDSMVNIVRLAFQGQQPVAYRTIVGLSGTDAARVYDQVIDTTRQSGIGSFGLPEIYTDATEAALGSQSAAAGITALMDAAGTVSVSLEVDDGNPFRLGDDFVAGDLATAVVSGASWRQRMTKVTVEDTRSGGLVITPTLGDRSDLTGDDMMVQALARVAESVRALQAGR